MSKWSRFSKPAFRVFLRTIGWMLLFALLPATLYTYTNSVWTGVKVFLASSLITTLGLLWAFLGTLFPDDGGEQ